MKSFPEFETMNETATMLNDETLEFVNGGAKQPLPPEQDTGKLNGKKNKLSNGDFSEFMPIK